MALLGNHAVLNKQPGRTLAGSTVSNTASNFQKSGAARNKFFQFAHFNSMPLGYRPPYCFLLAKKSGGLASQARATGVGTSGTVNLAGGLNAVSALAGSGDITNAAANLLKFATAALSGSGDVSSASLVAAGIIVAGLSGVGDISADGQLAQILEALADLTGSGSLSADASYVQHLEAVAALSGSGSISPPVLGALVDLVSALAGTASISSADISATGNISGDILPYTDLSPEALASAVWESVAAEHNVVGSMGEKVNDAGSASNPWTEVIEGTYTATEVLRLLLAVAAGKTTIVDHGGGSATITFRDTSDTTDRVVADMTGSERTTVTLDGT